MSYIAELIASNRSYRRFSADRRPTRDELFGMIDCARLGASAGNLQRLYFSAVYDEKDCASVFENIAFAAYLGSWRPAAEEAPGAYVIIWSCSEPDANLAIDAGIAAQSILLCARDMGYGGCMFRSIKKNELVKALGKSGFVPVLVIALGTPAETVVLTDVKDGNIRYYRDENGVHYVPKRALEDIII